MLTEDHDAHVSEFIVHRAVEGMVDLLTPIMELYGEHSITEDLWEQLQALQLAINLGGRKAVGVVWEALRQKYPELKGPVLVVLEGGLANAD